MIKDISFLNSGEYQKLINLVQLIDRNIDKHNQKIKELQNQKIDNLNKLRFKIITNFFCSIESDDVKNFLALPVQIIKDANFSPNGTLLETLTELQIGEKEISFGEIFARIKHGAHMFIKLDDIQKIGLIPTEIGLQQILNEILLLSDQNIVISFSKDNFYEEQFILLKGINYFKTEIVIA